MVDDGRALDSIARVSRPRAAGSATSGSSRASLFGTRGSTTRRTLSGTWSAHAPCDEQITKSTACPRSASAPASRI
jgi:hypothetical protein